MLIKATIIRIAPRVLALLALAIMLSAAGCATLDTRQQSELTTIKTSNPSFFVEEKTPSTAAILGILPGGGAFYTRQYGLGVLDLLLWPISVLWDPFVGYEGAHVINYQATKYNIDRMKRRELESLDDKIARKEIAEEQYRMERRKIDQKYTFE